jgi:hypothetical protein
MLLLRCVCVCVHICLFRSKPASHYHEQYCQLMPSGLFYADCTHVPNDAIVASYSVKSEWWHTSLHIQLNSNRNLNSFYRRRRCTDHSADCIQRGTSTAPPRHYEPLGMIAKSRSHLIGFIQTTEGRALRLWRTWENKAYMKETQKHSGLTAIIWRPARYTLHLLCRTRYAVHDRDQNRTRKWRLIFQESLPRLAAHCKLKEMNSTENYTSSDNVKRACDNSCPIRHRSHNGLGTCENNVRRGYWTHVDGKLLHGATATSYYTEIQICCRCNNSYNMDKKDLVQGIGTRQEKRNRTSSRRQAAVDPPWI